MISKNKFLKNAQKVEVKQQMETGGILNKADFIRQAQQAQRRQQDAFETYRAAVEEAKKTRANMGYPDVLSEQEFNRSGAMVQQHGTYDNYLLKAAGQYQAAKQEDISRQLTTQGLRREQTEQKNAAARMRAQGNLGTQALRQQSALLAGRFAPATQQVRGDVDAFHAESQQKGRFGFGTGKELKEGQRGRGKVSEQEFNRSEAMVAQYGSYSNYLRGVYAGYDEAAAAGTKRRAEAALAEGKVSEAEFSRAPAMVEQYGTYRNYLNGVRKSDDEITRERAAKRIESLGISDTLEQYYNAEGEEQAQLRQQLADKGVTGTELNEWRNTVFNQAGQFIGDLAAGFFQGGLLQNMSGMEGTMAGLENAANGTVAWALDDLSNPLPSGKLKTGIKSFANQLANADSRHEENARQLQEQNAQVMQQLTQGHSQAAKWIIEQMPSAGNMLLNVGTAGMAGVPNLAALGTTAGGNAYIEAKNDGATNEQALAYGIVNGSLEVLSEKLFGGNPLYDTDAGLVNQLVAKLTDNKTIMRILNSKGFDLLSEGLEEVVTEITEPWAQALIYAGKEAEFATLESVANAFAGGVFLSVVGNLADLPVSMRNREVQSVINDVTERVLYQAEQVADAGVQQAVADVREKMEYGEDVTAEDLGNVLNAMSEADAEVDAETVEAETAQAQEQAQAEAQERTFQRFREATEEGERNQAVFRETTQGRYETGNADPYAERGTQFDVSDERSAVYAAEEAGEISHAEAEAALNTLDSDEAVNRVEAAHVEAEKTRQDARDKKDAATAVERLRTQQEKADAELRRAEAKSDRAALAKAVVQYGLPQTLGNALPEHYAEYRNKNLGPLSAAEYADAVHAAYQAGRDGLNLNAAQKAAQSVQREVAEQAWNAGKGNNGTAKQNAPDDSSKRDASMDTGRSGGAVAESAGQTAKGQSERSRLAERIELENRVRAAKQPYLSGQDIGVEKGAAEKSLQEVPKKFWTKSIDQADAELRKAGYEDIHFFIGKIGVVNQKAQVVRYANGMRTGSSVWVCANDRAFTVEQIARHEAFHKIVEDAPGVLEAVRAQIASELGEEGLQALALRYAEAYEGCYGEDEIDRYVGEVCADAYAGLERFGEASKQAADAVWQTRQAEKSAEKPASPRGPPEEYSIERTTENKPFVEVEQDILAGVPKANWASTVKENLKKKFPSGITVGSNEIHIDKQSQREMTFSRYMQWLYNNDQKLLEDKLRATNNADEILHATTDWVNEGLNHPRKDRIVDFARGNVLLRVGGHDYTADVVVGTRDNGSMVLYDVLNLQITSFTEKETNAAITTNPSPGAGRSTASVSEFSISQTEENVNAAEGKQDQEPETQTITMDTIPKKAQNYLNGAARNLAAALQRKTMLPFADHSTEIRDSIKPLMNEYLQTGDIRQETIDKSFDEAYAKGVELEKELYEKSKTLAQKLRQTPITLNEKERAALRSYDVFKKTTKGRLYVVNEGGRSINAVYQEMSRAMPEVFPRGAKGTEEQILTLLAGSHRLDLAKSNAEGAAGRYAEEYKQTAKQDYENGVRDMMGDLRVARRYAEAQARRMEPFVAPKSYDEVQELYSQQNEQRRAYERVDRKYLLTAEDRKVVNRLLRGDITPEKVTGMENAEGILAVYEAKADYDLTTLKIQEWRKSVKAERMETARKTLGNISEAKDKKAGIWYKRETQERNARDIFKADTAERIIDHYFRPVHHAAAEETRLKNRMKGQIEALGLKRHAVRGDRVSESAAVQILGEAQDNIRVLEASRGRLKAREGRTLQEWDAVVQELWKTSPHLDKTRIENAVQEFRGIYDELFQMMNEVRVRNGYAPINYRSGYFPHFQVGASDGILNLMGAAMGIDAGIEVLPTDLKGIFQWILQQKKNGKAEQGPDALPTTINGRTGGFKPGITWFGNSLERTGFQTAYDAVKGFDKYIEGAAKVIFYTDSIQNLRALATETRYLTGDDGLRERIDAVRADESLNEAQKDVSVEDIQKNGRYSLSRWAANLDEYTNLLAGKKSELDRPIEQMTSRDMYRLLNKWQGRVAANMVAVNPASWLTNFGVIQQAAAQLNEDSLMKARAQAAANTFRNDGFEERSDFLTSRRGSSMLVNGWVDNASAALSKPMEVIDMYSANVIVRARYMDNLRRGMSEEFAMQEADEFAAGVMADRSKGAQPTLFESRNPLTKMFTQFQLEVNNTFSYLFKDLPREQRKRGVAAVAFTMFMYLLRNWFFNEGYEKMIGRRPMFDPFNMITETVGNYTGYTVNNMWDAIDGTEDGIVTKKEAKGAGAATWDTMVRIGQEIPGIGGLLGGGRLPFASTMPDVENILNLLDKDIPGDKKWPKVAEALKAPAVYWLPPFGGGQAKKIYEGSKAVVNKGSYKLNGDGEEQLQYPVYTDRKGDLIRAWTSNILFGKSSTKAARDWVESGFQSLSVKETKAYQAITEGGEDQRKTYTFVQAIKNVEKEYDKKMLLKSYSISDTAKTAYFYQVFANEDQQKEMDKLDEQGKIDFMKKYLAEAEDNHNRDELRDAAVAGTVTQEKAIQRMVANDWAKDEDDAYWKYREWIRKADDKDYKMYDDFLNAIEAGGDVKEVAKEYLEHGKEAKDLSRQITTAYKEQYLAATPEERRKLKQKLLEIYAALGFNRKEKSKDIDKWVKDAAKEKKDK
ncbi:MAG: hypothetical protein J6J02_07075 [Oscillospiraceae bacterium]|nr:hypothetical protein [Oscillospiraceae bacterium]